MHTFPKGICPKARLEYDSAVHRFNHYTTRTPPHTFLGKVVQLKYIEVEIVDRLCFEAEIVVVPFLYEYFLTIQVKYLFYIDFFLS